MPIYRREESIQSFKRTGSLTRCGEAASVLSWLRGRSGRLTEALSFAMEPSARFEVSNVFALRSRGSVVLTGRVSAGNIVPGMHILVWLDGGLFWSLPIESVEFVDGPGKLSQVGLVLAGQGREEFELLSGLCPVGTEVEVKAPARVA